MVWLGFLGAGFLLERKENSSSSEDWESSEQRGSISFVFPLDLMGLVRGRVLRRASSRFARATAEEDLWGDLDGEEEAVV